MYRLGSIWVYGLHASIAFVTAAALISLFFFLNPPGEPVSEWQRYVFVIAGIPVVAISLALLAGHRSDSLKAAFLGAALPLMAAWGSRYETLNADEMGSTQSAVMGMGVGLASAISGVVLVGLTAAYMEAIRYRRARR